MRLFIASVLGSVLSALLVLIIVLITAAAKQDINNNSQETKSQTIVNTLITGLSKEKIERDKKLSDCLDQYPYPEFSKQHEACYKTYKPVKDETPDLPVTITPQKKQYQTPLFIKIIYVLQFVALWIQFTLAIYFALNYFNFKYGFDVNATTWFSKWSIEAPPMLGVAGTIYAFSLAARVEPDKITDIFKDSFNDAAFTTIMGIMIYVVNLALVATYNKESKNLTSNSDYVKT